MRIVIRSFPFFLAAILLSGCASSSFSSSAVVDEIVSVEQWGGTPADDSRGRPHTIDRITLHHAGVPFPPEKDIVQYMRNLQSWSRREKQWIDLPYHYIVDLKGNIYEGRDIRYAGDTNTEYDPAGHALIEVVGNYEEAEPNAEQLDAVVRTMAMLAVRYNVPVDSIRAHKDYSARTVCPGKNLYRYIESGFFRTEIRRLLDSK